MAYTLNVKYTDAKGNLTENPLTGPHTMILDAVAKPLAVELKPKGNNVYDLLVTANSTTEIGPPTGIGPYEIFIAHHKPAFEVVQAGLANGAHFMVLQPDSATMQASLVNIPATSQQPMRVYLSLTEVEGGPGSTSV